jgi:hypothetical protein
MAQVAYLSHIMSLSECHLPVCQTHLQLNFKTDIKTISWISRTQSWSRGQGSEACQALSLALSATTWPLRQLRGVEIEPSHHSLLRLGDAEIHRWLGGTNSSKLPVFQLSVYHYKKSWKPRRVL